MTFAQYFVIVFAAIMLLELAAFAFYVYKIWTEPHPLGGYLRVGETCEQSQVLVGEIGEDEYFVNDSRALLLRK